MQLTSPIWLWGLAGLIIPIAIHLLHRKESKIIKIGSIRHLEASNTKQSMNLRLNELLLLAMRCLLIALVVLLLGGLHFNDDQTKSEQWIIIENGLENDPDYVPLIDSLQEQGFQLKRMDEGFPPLADLKTNAPINYWKLVEELSYKSLKQSVVLSYNYAKGFKGKRSSRPSNLMWISKNPAPIEFPLKAVKVAASSVSIRMGNSTASETAFRNLNAPLNPNQSHVLSSVDSTSIERPDTLIITMVSDLEFSNDKNILLAALQAVEETITTIFSVKILPPDLWTPEQKTDWMIWLSNKGVAESVQCNRIIFSESKAENKGLFERERSPLSEQAIWLLAKRLNEEVALQEKLPVKLVSILLSKKELERKAAEFDRRVQPEQMLWSPERQSNKKNFPAADPNIAAQVLAILILIALVLERLIAFKRHQ